MTRIKSFTELYQDTFLELNYMWLNQVLDDSHPEAINTTPEELGIDQDYWKIYDR